MYNTIFRITYEKPVLHGKKEATVILREEKAFELIKKCRKKKYKIIRIEHV